MQRLYCANCGRHLTVIKKALPKYSVVIDLVEQHECSSEPVEFDLSPSPAPAFLPTIAKGKFAQNLDDLRPPTTPVQADLRDRREPSRVEPSSIAPDGILKKFAEIRQSLGEDEEEPNG